MRKPARALSKAVSVAVLCAASRHARPCAQRKSGGTLPAHDESGSSGRGTSGLAYWHCEWRVLRYPARQHPAVCRSDTPCRRNAATGDITRHRRRVSSAIPNPGRSASCGCRSRLRIPRCRRRCGPHPARENAGIQEYPPSGESAGLAGPSRPCTCFAQRWSRCSPHQARHAVRTRA